MDFEKTTTLQVVAYAILFLMLNLHDEVVCDSIVGSISKSCLREVPAYSHRKKALCYRTMVKSVQICSGCSIIVTERHCVLFAAAEEKKGCLPAFLTAELVWPVKR